MSRKYQPDPDNTRNRPEAWLAKGLQAEADMLLDKIIRLGELQIEWATDGG